MQDESNPGGRDLTRDEALLWLNDRLGKSVNASVVIDVGDSSVSLFEAEGELRHWWQTYPTDKWAGDMREDIAGLYNVGEGGGIDLTDVAGKAISARDDIDELRIELAKDVTLKIIEQIDLEGGES